MENVQGSNINDANVSGDVIAAAAPPGDTWDERRVLETSILVGDDLEKAIQEIMLLGYSRNQATVAMEASCNDPNRAVHHLITINGPMTPVDTSGVIGEEGEGETQGNNQSTFPAIQKDSSQTDDDPLTVFASQPQFSQIRQMLTSSPQLMTSFLQQVRRTNPRLHQAISENRDRFQQTLNEPIGLQAEVGGAAVGAGAAVAPFAVGSIILPDVEHRAIERLMELGFSESYVVQAYFACDKSEELTAEFLLSQEPDYVWNQ